jgi:lipopolysaccharide export system permease protein
VKRLYLFSLKSFIGPFIVTLFISMFILVMQFFWKYIDDLMGKGLEFSIILELLLYVSAHLLPLALPLAVLLSSIMTMGNLAENNELTALKASGLSLYKIMRPLLLFMTILALITFYFSNFVIPVANLKMRALIYDIQQTKISLVLKPGTFSKEITGFSIKVQKSNNNTFEDVTIYDETNPFSIRVIKADSGEVYRSQKGEYLLFHLYNGMMNEELPTNETTYNKDGSVQKNEFHPGRKSFFESATFKLDLSGFQIQRSDAELFKNQFEMMNILQLSQAKDSFNVKINSMTTTFAKGTLSEHIYFLSKDYIQEQKTNPKQLDSVFLRPDTGFVRLADLNTSHLRVAYNENVSKIRKRLQNIESQKFIVKGKEDELVKIDMEFHKKFALSISVLILFFIGAPLGAIVKKGGFGAPVVIAVLLFMIYYVISITGENMVKTEVVTPAFGVWLSSIILLPFAVFLNYKAANDLPIFQFDWSFFKRIFSKK